MRTISRVIAASAVAAAALLLSVTPAVAARHKHHGTHSRHRAHVRHHSNRTNRHNGSRHHRLRSGTSPNGETPLSGQTLQSASAAAIAANPGATVDSASTETDSSISGAAYEVHITQPDDSRAVVIEDSNFNVLATQSDQGGCGGPSGGSNGETPLTGQTLQSASAAAIAGNPGATVDFATTETDGSLSGAAYEVHITQQDGSHAVVIEDSNFNVLATQAESDHSGGGWGGH